MTCPKCKQAAEFKDHLPKTVVSILGTIHFRRAYYYCRRCGCGLFPFDEAVGFSPHRLTPGAERLVSLLGLTCDGFEEAARKLLPEACGLHLGESTVQRVTEDAGARLGQLQEAGHTLGDSKPFDWHKDANGRTCAYVSLDLTSVPQQAFDHGKAEGRMPYVAAIYNPVPEKAKPDCEKAKPDSEKAQAEQRQPLPIPGYEPVEETRAAKNAMPQPGEPQDPKRPRMQARYISGLMSLAALGILLRKQAAQVGMEKATQWIALSDGGSGLEHFQRTNFNRPNLVIILDFYHPASYLDKLALALEPGDEEGRRALAQGWCHKLKHQGGQALLDELKALPPPRGKTASATLEETLTYFTNQVHRMDYPHYVKQGWQIGSGPIESACKTVVGQRLKQAGMRWRENGTDNVCHLRALYRSEKDQWEAFWESRVNKSPICYPKM